MVVAMLLPCIDHMNQRVGTLSKRKAEHSKRLLLRWERCFFLIGIICFLLFMESMGLETVEKKEQYWRDEKLATIGYTKIII